MTKAMKNDRKEIFQEVFERTNPKPVFLDPKTGQYSENLAPDNVPVIRTRTSKNVKRGDKDVGSFKKTNLCIDADLFLQVKILCVKERITFTEIVNLSLEDFLRKRRRKEEMENK